jgi:L,D-peptidoglycan transpeptidase YkuD (ErfK/YbiS/YcfS/YnhG family)
MAAHVFVARASTGRLYFPGAPKTDDGIADEQSRISVRCALGRGGVISADLKREGDGCSPIGVWPLRRFLVRADRLPSLLASGNSIADSSAPNPASQPLPDECALARQCALPVGALLRDDGWCDDANDAQHYNRAVTLPHPSSCEALWRDEDAVYDIIGILGHNDDPEPVPGRGSAIFLHIATDDYAPTAGCVAVALPDLLALMAAARGDSCVEIRAD